MVSHPGPQVPCLWPLLQSGGVSQQALGSSGHSTGGCADEAGGGAVPPLWDPCGLPLLYGSWGAQGRWSWVHFVVYNFLCVGGVHKYVCVCPWSMHVCVPTYMCVHMLVDIRGQPGVFLPPLFFETGPLTAFALT